MCNHVSERVQPLCVAVVRSTDMHRSGTPASAAPFVLHGGAGDILQIIVLSAGAVYSTIIIVMALQQIHRLNMLYSHAVADVGLRNQG